MYIVLVVDGTGDLAKGVSDALAGTAGQYLVIERRTGRSAISAVQEGVGIDLVVVDDRLEDMDGMDLLVSIKRIAPDLPIVMSSGNPSVEAYLRAVSAGVFEFITRPVSSPILGSILSAALEGTASFQRLIGS